MAAKTWKLRRALFTSLALPAAALASLWTTQLGAQTPGRSVTLLPPTERPAVIQVRAVSSESAPQQMLPQKLPSDSAPQQILPQKLPSDTAPQKLQLQQPPSAQPVKTGLTLEQLVALATQNNPELAAAHARADAARGRLIQAGLYINPKLLWEAAMMSLNRGNSAGEQGPLLFQEVVTANKIKLSEQAAAHGVEAADWAAVTKQYDIITRVRLAFFEVLTAQAEVQANDSIEKYARDGLAATLKLEKVGAAVRPDILQSEVEVSNARLRLSLSKQRLETAWKYLATTTGMPDLQPAPLAFSLEATPPNYEWQSALTTVLSRSSEAQEAQALIRQADQLIARAHAEKCPNLLLGVRPFWTQADQAAQLDVQIGFNIPVFNRNQGNIYSAQADFVAAQEFARQVDLKLQDRLNAAFQRYQNAKKQVEAYDSGILRKAKESLDLVKIGYERGDAKYSYGVLLNAQRTVAQAELSRVQALGEVWKAAAEIAGLLQE